jgi:hypothetical protein
MLCRGISDRDIFGVLRLRAHRYFHYKDFSGASLRMTKLDHLINPSCSEDDRDPSLRFAITEKAALEITEWEIARHN